MNAFENASLVETRGMARLMPYLQEQAHGNAVILTAKGRLSRFLQETIGDAVFAALSDKSLVSVEIKVEERWTGNLFLETWSNRNLENPDRHAYIGSNVGWLYKCRADALLYYFIDIDTLITCSVFSLKRWAFCEPSGRYAEDGRPIIGKLTNFPEVPQSKYAQLNDTRGCLVPVSVLRAEIGAKRIRIQQLELPGIAA